MRVLQSLLCNLLFSASHFEAHWHILPPHALLPAITEMLLQSLVLCLCLHLWLLAYTLNPNALTLIVTGCH